MPENAYRRAHLYQHLARSGGSVSSTIIAQLRREHPEWIMCAAGCGWPMHPAGQVGGFTTHPTCQLRRPVAEHRKLERSTIARAKVERSTIARATTPRR